jgi:hypothetical protein
LAPDAAARRDKLLASEFARVVALCAGRRFEAAVCTLALVYVPQHDVALAGELCALTGPYRASLLQRADDQGLWQLWSPVHGDWDHALRDLWTQERVQEGERVGAELIAAGCQDPEGAVNCELAWRLSRHDWSSTMTVSDDFACFAVEHEVTEDMFDTFRVTAPAAAAYQQRNWLRFPNHRPPFW